MVDDPSKLAVWLTTPNHIFVEIAKDLGYSKFLLDIEHGLFDLEPTDRLIAFIKALGCEVYAKVLEVLDDTAKERLKIAQRAWCVYRDSEAQFRADAEARGGSMWPLVHEGVRSKLTKERVKALKEYLIEDKEK